MSVRWDGDTNKFRVIKNENIGAYNTNTMYTFDNIFGIIVKYLRMKTEMFLGRPLMDVEIPNRDKSNQTLDSAHDIANKTVMPRAIILYEINPMDEDLVEIPTLKTHFDINNGIMSELYGMRKLRLDDSIIKELDVYRDVDISLFGTMGFTSAIMTYTVLLDNPLEAIELQKQFKMNMPINSLHDIYRAVYRTTDITGEEDNTGYMVKNKELIPFTTKAVIPNDMIDYFKNNLCISLEDPEGDDKLLAVFNKYSYGSIGREIDGSTRKPIWTVGYQLVPILVPTDLEKSSNVKDMSETWAVRVMFQLNYIEMKAFKIRCKYKVLSYENPENYIENYKPLEDEYNRPIGIETLKVAGEFGDLVKHFTLKLSYETSDFLNNEMKLDIASLCLNRDKYFEKYMHYLQSSLIEDDYKFYKIIVKHGSRQTPDTSVETSPGTYFSYDDLCTYDSKSKVGDIVYIIGYVDMKKYRAWKIAAGFEVESNASSKYMK